MDGERLLKKIRLKELNNLNTDKEYIEVMEIIADALRKGEFPDLKDEPDPIEVPEDPLKACYVIYPAYNESFAGLQEAYIDLINHSRDNDCREHFFSVAVDFAKISSFLGLKILDYSYDESIEEFRFPGISEHPFLSTFDKENLTPFEKIVKVFYLAEMTHRYVYNALCTTNKSQLIALGALLNVSARDLLHSIG